MKLSEAMLRGAEMNPQWFGRLWHMEENVWHTCALGSTLHGMFGIREAHTKHLEEVFPELEGLLEDLTIHSCPHHDCMFSGYSYKTDTIKDLIIHLNDDHMDAREWIAAYLSSKGL